MQIHEKIKDLMYEFVKFLDNNSLYFRMIVLSSSVGHATCILRKFGGQGSFQEMLGPPRPR